MQIGNDTSELRKCPISELGASSGMFPVEVPGPACGAVELFPKLPISTTLRGLRVGESANFPWEQRTSLFVIANRIKKELARTGWDFSYLDDEVNYIVKITRIR